MTEPCHKFADAAARFDAVHAKDRSVAKVVRGVRNNPNIGSTDMSNDSTAAYSHALQWSLTEKKPHAAKAIEILNVWSATLESVSGHDAKLLIGMDGVKFCNAAELIRHTSDEWQVADQSRFERMLRQVLYPVIEDFHPTANGNWDASMIQTMIAMGVFLDDRATNNLFVVLDHLIWYSSEVMVLAPLDNYVFESKPELLKEEQIILLLVMKMVE